MAPSNLMPEGIWRPLDASRNEIRLLHIQPAWYLEARVVCSLSTHSIDDIEDPRDEDSYKDDVEPKIDANAPLHFTAISYACGDIRDTTEITIEGRPYPALSTLVSAIRYMRHEKYEQIVWADQLCINQFDPDERAQQILLMKLIYAKAGTMRVWLGLPDDHEYARKFLNSMLWESGEGLDPRIFESQEILDQAEEETVEIGFLPGKLIDLKGNSMWDLTRTEESTERLLRAMEHFISRAWFERVWTIQEFALASGRTCFHYGTIKTRMLSIFKMVMSIGSFVLNAIYQPTRRRMELERSKNLLMTAEVALAHIGRPFGWSASNAMGTLGEKIGMAAFASYARHQQKASASIVERRNNLFGDRVENLKLTCSRILAIHEMAVLDEDELPESVRFHSLVLATRSRFSTDPRDKIYGLLGLCHTSFVQDMTVDYRISFEEVYRRWAVLAVQELQKPFLLKNAQPHQPSTNLPSWVPDLSQPIPGETLTLLNTVEQGYNAWRRGKKFPLKLFNGRVLKCTSLPIDIVEYVIDLPNGHPRKLAHQYACQEVARIYGLEAIIPDQSPDYIVEGTIWQALLQTLHVGLLQNVGSEMLTGQPYGLRKLTEKLDSLPTIFSMDTSSTRLFLTEMGYIGISFAPDVKRGDELFLLCDSRLPLILRKAPVALAAGISGISENNVFRLVASTFVTGLMKGEIFKSKPQLQPQSQSRIEGKLDRWRKKLFEEDSEEYPESETGPYGDPHDDLYGDAYVKQDVDPYLGQDSNFMGQDPYEDEMRSMKTPGEIKRDRWLTKIGLKKDRKKEKKEKETIQDLAPPVIGDETEPKAKPEDYYLDVFLV